MRYSCVHLPVLLCCLLVEARIASAGINLDGIWEVQTMGADRKIEIEQKGNRIKAYRVLWPEFEGKAYKLEHLYKGKVRGPKIQGDLMVREEGLPDFEVLRGFKGSISSNTEIILDGLPMRRVSNRGKGSSLLKSGPSDSGRAARPPELSCLQPVPIVETRRKRFRPLHSTVTLLARLRG